MTTKQTKLFAKEYYAQYPWLEQAIKLPSSNFVIAEIDPHRLKDNPKNWRVHSQRQRSTYRAFKERHGWLGTVIFNLVTDRLLDGHMRVDEAIKAGDKTVPVRIVAVTEEEENEILLSFDPIGSMAQKNTQALKALSQSNLDRLGRLKDDKERKIAQLSRDLSEAADSEDYAKPDLAQAKNRLRPVRPDKPAPAPKIIEIPDSPEEIELPGRYKPREALSQLVQTEINERAFFPGVSWLGIPELLSTMIATPDLAPSKTFDGKNEDPENYCCYSQAFLEDMQFACVGFYTEDYRFDYVYEEPARFLEFIEQFSPRCLIAPDFSAYTAWPLIMNLMAVYRSRWVARFWQEFSYFVIPTIQIVDASPYPLTTKFVLETLPVKQTPTVSLECRLDNPKDAPILIDLIKRVVDVVKPECIVLYAGQEKQKYIHGYVPKGIDYRFLPATVTLAKQRQRRTKNG